MLKNRILATAVGFSLVVPASLGLLISGAPTVLCPFPTVTILPAMALSGLWKVAVIVPSLLFFGWNTGLLRGDAAVPKRSYRLLLVLLLLSVGYFVASWQYGLEYQGLAHTRAVCGINVAWAIALVAGFSWSWRVRPSFGLNLFLHWLLFAWLAWYAFPYLGELP
jgi:hypothetical protein